MASPEQISDYQQYALSSDGVTNPGPRMQAKLEAINLPDDMTGMRVLDVGCDMGFWSFLCASRGAEVVGIDRNREVNGEHTDLVALNQSRAQRHGLSASFGGMEVGRNWYWCGSFDLVLCMSMYHHAYAICEDHNALMFWLRSQCKPDGKVIWESPANCDDPVSRAHIPPHAQGKYTLDHVLVAAERFFEVGSYGPALHEPHRIVMELNARHVPQQLFTAKVQAGAGGASKAWAYASGRRIREFREATTMTAIPGSLNMTGPVNMDAAPYFRSKFLDVVDRKAGMGSEWVERWCRLYPCHINSMPAYLFRFEGESYPDEFMEAVSYHRLRNHVAETAQVLM